MRRITILCLALVLASVASAAAAPARSGGGWTTHRVAAAHVRLEAPASWIDVTRLTPTVLARVRKLPALEAYVSALQRSQAIKLMLVDAGPQTVANGYATSCNLAQVPTIGDLRLQHDANLAQLRSASFVRGAVHSSYVRLPAGKALEFRYRARYGPSLPTVSLVQFLLVHAGKVDVLTFTTLPKLDAAERPAFLRTARSLRFA